MKYALLIFVSAVTLCHGQGTFTVTFDLPPMPPGNYLFQRNYYEVGMWFRHETEYDINVEQFRAFSGSTSVPDNGTTYLRPASGEALIFSLTNGDSFDLMSLDFSKAFASRADGIVGSFTGYLIDGGTVFTNVSVSGLTFQTFIFGPEFSGLVRVEAVGYWALDNIVFSTIPEPSSFVLCGIGVLMLAVSSIRKCRSRQ